MYPGRRELANRGLSKTNGIGCSMQHPTRPKNSPTIQELPGKGPPPRSNARRFLVRSLVAYLAIATALSICQIGYVNADFVGYSAIAHRLLKDPRTSITGYWSPLYSWCMAPLIYLGVDDLIAGRVILMVGGVIYLLAIFGVVCRSHGADQRRNRVITIAVMTVAVLQAATWATRMPIPTCWLTACCSAISMRSWIPCCRKGLFTPCWAEPWPELPTWAKPTCSPSRCFTCRQLY